MEGLNFQPPEGVELKWLEPAEGGIDDMPIYAMLMLAGIVAVAVPCALTSLVGPPREHRADALSGELPPVALVVAHPDDEAMFFWPTLLQLCAAGADVSVLCLSTGNFDGLGATRKEEMCRSCARLRIGPKSLDILDLDSLQDGFWAWPEDVIAARVREFVRTRGVGLVLTFDGIGVSGHPNHISTSLGVRRACDICAADRSSSFEVLLLESAPLPWKYFGWLCIWADGFCERADAARCTCRSPLACLRALACHWSQLVWYRVLFTLFSRYAFVNTYVRHVPPTAAPAEPAQEAEDAAPGALRQRRKQ